MANQYSFQDRAAIEAFNYYLHCEDEPLNASFSLRLYRELKAAATDDLSSAVIWSDLRERFDFAGLAPRNTKETQLYRLYILIEARVRGAAEPAFSTHYTAEAARAHAGAFRTALLAGEGETLHLPYKGNLTSAETILADYLATHSGAAARRVIEIVSGRGHDGNLASLINNCIEDYAHHLQCLAAD